MYIYVYIYIVLCNVIAIIHAFITQGVLEQLVNCFNEAAEGICS